MWYFAEGDWFNGTCSFVSALPLAGDIVGKGSKAVGKIIKGVAVGGEALIGSYMIADAYANGGGFLDYAGGITHLFGAGIQTKRLLGSKTHSTPASTDSTSSGTSEYSIDDGLSNFGESGSISVEAGEGTVKNKGWNVGNPIDNLTKAGNEPSWDTVRARYWKNKAYYNSGSYSSENLELMKKGRAPRYDTIDVPKELHHEKGRNIENPHNINNLQEVWPWEHAEIDKHRKYTGPRP